MDDRIRTKVEQFLAENFFIDFSGTDDTENLLEAGFIDSQGYVQLVHFLESNFKIEIPTDDLLNDSLVSLGSIVKYVSQKASEANI